MATAESLDAFLKWARDEEAVKKWQRQINLKKILGTRPNVMSKDKRERGNGVLARLSNFFPDEVAQGAAVIASRVPEERWNTLEWTGDSSQPSLDGIAAVHRFGAVVEASDLVGVSELYHVLSGLMPPCEPTCLLPSPPSSSSLIFLPHLPPSSFCLIFLPHLSASSFCLSFRLSAGEVQRVSSGQTAAGRLSWIARRCGVLRGAGAGAGAGGAGGAGAGAGA
eukprot:706492-Hanusia_phi.AAC.1